MLLADVAVGSYSLVRIESGELLNTIVGEVVEKGSKVSNLEIGDAVLLMAGGCFAEYQAVSQRTVMKIAKSSADYIVLFASGLTASLALEEVGQMKTKETVLVTGKWKI